MPSVKRPPVGINPNVPLVVQRELRKVAGFAFDAQDRADKALAGLDTKVGKGKADLLEVSQFVNGQLQAGGEHPLNLTGLIGAQTGVVAGTYVVGLKLTGGGQNGSITVNAQGLITAITPAT